MVRAARAYDILYKEEYQALSESLRCGADTVRHRDGLVPYPRERFLYLQPQFFYEPKSRRSAEVRMDNSPIYGNPMVYDREYFSIIENTGVLSVRVLLSEKKYSYYPPSC